MFQRSTINALMQGVYDSNTTFEGELKSYGNFGLGTVWALDGEMIELKEQPHMLTFKTIWDLLF